MLKAKFLPRLFFMLCIMLPLCISSAYAVELNINGTPNAADMLINISKNVPQLMRLVTALAYLIGFWCVFKAIVEFRHFGEGRTMMSREHHLGVPLTFLFVGAALIYLPSTIKVGLNTFFIDTNPLAYLDTNSQDVWAPLTDGVFLIVQLIGVISLIRGLLMLTRAHGHHGQQGGFGKAIAHIIAGIFCINFYNFLNVILATLSIGNLS